MLRNTASYRSVLKTTTALGNWPWLAPFVITPRQPSPYDYAV